jgi:5-(carboxyamino)imidazole ribonucleotide mutase
VATVAINGAENAALLAVRMLAIGDPALTAQLDEHRSELAEAATAQDQGIQKGGD